jgi:hypothetical protein
MDGDWWLKMISINAYILYTSCKASYYPLRIPKKVEILVSANSRIISVLPNSAQGEFEIIAYAEEESSSVKLTKEIALVTEALPGDGVGWRFLNSFVVQLSSIETKVVHAYAKIC